MWSKSLIRSRKLSKTSHSPPISRYISEMVEYRWVHAARRLTSIEFSFDPCNVYRDGPRGVGYPADAPSVGGSHPSCYLTLVLRFYCYAHVLRLGVRKSPHEFKYKNNKRVCFQLHLGVFDHGEFKESDRENYRQPEIAIWPPKPEIIIYL